MAVFSGELSWPDADTIQIRNPLDSEVNLSGGSVVELGNRRLLFVWSEGASIYEVIVDLNTVITSDGWVGNTLALTPTEIMTDIDGPRSAVFKVDNTVYLATTWYSKVGDTNMATRIWRRGSGGGWTLHGTVREDPVAPTGFGLFNTQYMVGVPTVFGNRWVLPAVRFYPESGPQALHWKAAVYVSTDAGVTWELREEWGWWFGGQYGFQIARDLAYFDGYLYWSGSGGVEGVRVARSDDLGQNWADLVNTGSAPPSPFGGSDGSWNYGNESARMGFAAVDDNYIYINHSGTIYRTTDVTNFDNWELVETYLGTFAYGLMSPVSFYGFLYFDSRSHVLGIPAVICLPYVTSQVGPQKVRVFGADERVTITSRRPSVVSSIPRQKCGPCEEARSRKAGGRVFVRRKRR